MDVRLQGNSAHHYKVNGGARRNPRPGENNTLKYLSQEEKECLQFFEDTIESLEEGLKEDQRPAQVSWSEGNRGLVDRVDGLPSVSPNRGVNVTSRQDIIDLVHPEPSLVHSKEPIFNPTNPDFQHILSTPESHFEVKPMHNSVPSEYDPPLPGGGYRSTDNHSSYHPPGSIPTPVLIAHKIAENQGDGTAHLHPSTLLRRLSLESEKSNSNRPNVHVKHSTPTSAMPRYPPNISVVRSSKEPPKSVDNVNVHERQEQMLSNLSGTSHPLVQDISQQGMEQTARNTPSRSISFRDPEPDKSRMEALSKLGLSRTRATSIQNISGNTSQDLRKVPETQVKSPEARAKSPKVSLPPITSTSIGLPEPNVIIPPPSYFHDNRKPETFQTHSFQSRDERSSRENPSSPTITQNKHHSPPPADTSSLEFNSYGGKSVNVQPSVPTKSEPVAHPTSHEPKNLPSALSSPTALNPYGGKSKVMTPAPTTRSNLPDILSSHMDKGQTTPAKLEPQPAELNSYGGKSRSINPITGPTRSTSSPAKSVKPPPPATAPRPPRHSYPSVVTPQKSPTQVLSPDYRRKPSSMFRPQGITVQFCGRGAMNDSRREALRKLGLLKDS